MPSPAVEDTRDAILRPRKRAARACQSCHARKVRCSLTQTGTPCMNCSLDHLVCEAGGTKRQRTKTRGAPIQRPNVASSLVNNSFARPRVPTASRGSPPNLGTPAASSYPTHRQGTGGALMPSVDTNRDGSETPYRLVTEHFSHHGDGQGEIGMWHADENTPGSRYAPIYGDPQGVALVADICEPERRDKSGHFLVPQIRPPHLDPETIDYLRLKGVFELPTSVVCEMLIQTYFHHVHPFFPVVEATSFIETFESSRRDELSIHLLWSMFLAAANVCAYLMFWSDTNDNKVQFADDNTLEAANFSSRKEMKRSMYTKAKALYDAEHERSKINLIQAVLLMGFWYADTEDRTGPWHWNGVAIGLCQTIGLHRDPDSSPSHARVISIHDRRLWRQLWWSCFYREAWFSAGMGRPMRIHLADCNTPIPDANESEEQLAALDSSLREKYLTDSIGELTKMWTQLLNVTVTLSDILLQQHRAIRVLPSRPEVERTESQVRAYCGPHDDTRVRNDSHILSLYAYHIELYVESVSLILYRPFLLANSAESSFKDWGPIIEQRTRSAAINTNRILSNMISAGMINICQPMICIALVPALQIHLLDYTSQKSIVQRMGYQHLELCMIVIEELKKTFFGAEILYRIFTKAQKQIRDRRFPVIVAAPVNCGNDVATSSNTSANDVMPEISQDVYQSNQKELDVMSAIWNSYTPMLPYDFFDEPAFLLYDS